MRFAPIAFAPIAIVGRACVLPGALSPAQLWQAVAEGRDLLGPAPPDRWQIDPAQVMSPDRRARSRVVDIGGYFQGSSAVGIRGFAMPRTSSTALIRWRIDAALRREARNECKATADLRRGAVFGNLGFRPQDAAFSPSV